MSCCFLLQGIFPTQGSNPSLPTLQQTLYSLNHQGGPPSICPVAKSQTRLSNRTELTRSGAARSHGGAVRLFTDPPPVFHRGRTCLHRTGHPADSGGQRSPSPQCGSGPGQNTSGQVCLWTKQTPQGSVQPLNESPVITVGKERGWGGASPPGGTFPER